MESYFINQRNLFAAEKLKALLPSSGLMKNSRLIPQKLKTAFALALTGDSKPAQGKELSTPLKLSMCLSDLPESEPERAGMLQDSPVLQRLPSSEKEGCLSMVIPLDIGALQAIPATGNLVSSMKSCSHTALNLLISHRRQYQHSLKDGGTEGKIIRLERWGEK